MENPFATGVVVGARWQITEPLGQGVFGKAFLVTDKTSASDSEASMSVWDQPNTPEQHETFSLRMKQLTLTEHTNLTAYLYYGEHGNGSQFHTYVVSELCDTSLDAHLPIRTGSRLPTLEVYRLLQDLADGLVFLHDRNIVHGGIDPSTAVNCDGVWKLAEFGLDAGTTASGPSTFSAPELSNGKQPTPSSDVYALGMLGLLCSTGDPTTDGGWSASKIASAKLVPPIAESVDPSLRDLLRRSTELNPADRVTAKQLQRLLTSS